MKMRFINRVTFEPIGLNLWLWNVLWDSCHFWRILRPMGNISHLRFFQDFQRLSPSISDRMEKVTQRNPTRIPWKKEGCVETRVTEVTVLKLLWYCSDIALILLWNCSENRTGKSVVNEGIWEGKVETANCQSAWKHSFEFILEFWIKTMSCSEQ